MLLDTFAKGLPVRIKIFLSLTVFAENPYCLGQYSDTSLTKIRSRLVSEEIDNSFLSLVTYNFSEPSTRGWMAG